MIKSILIAGAVALATFGTPANAATVTFIPPSDLVGQVYSTNSNDGYAAGRGVVFTPTSTFTLTSVGIFQNLTNVTISYTVEAATAISGITGAGTVLRSGSALVSTGGLEWIDFNFADLNLASGTAYNVAFFFAGSSKQNFFYDQSGAQPYAQPGFSNIDGFSNYRTSNFVLPAIRLNGVAGAVPEPATWLMMVAGFGLVGASLRRTVRSTTAVAA